MRPRASPGSGRRATEPTLLAGCARTPMPTRRGVGAGVSPGGRGRGHSVGHSTTHYGARQKTISNHPSERPTETQENRDEPWTRSDAYSSFHLRVSCDPPPVLTTSNYIGVSRRG